MSMEFWRGVQVGCVLMTAVVVLLLLSGCAQPPVCDLSNINSVC